MKNIKYLWSVGLILVVIISIGLLTQTAREAQIIKIGVLTPLSGDAAIYGESLKKGLDLAAEEINKTDDLGRKVELIYEDTHLDSKTAVSAFSKFTGVDKLDIIIAAEGSGATSAVVPLADESKTLVMIPLASADSLKKVGDYVFRIIPSDDYRGREIAQFTKSLGAETTSIFYVNDAYGVGIKDIVSTSFTALGGKIVAVETFMSGDIDYRSQLIKIKETNPDIIVIAARKEFPIIMKQLRSLGIDSKIVASEIIDNSILSEAKNAMEGVLSLDFAPATDYVSFKENFKSKYGVDAPLYSDYGYDSLMVIATAIKEARSADSTKIKNILYKINYKGATGEIKFDSNGEVTAKTMLPMVVKDGSWELLPEKK